MTEIKNVALELSTHADRDWKKVRAMVIASPTGDHIIVTLSHDFGLSTQLILSPEAAFDLAQALMDMRLAANEIAEQRAAEVAA